MLYLFEDYVLGTERRELRRGQALVAIEPKVFDLLAFVIEHRQRVVSRDDLIAQVWDGRIVSESALARCISEARSAIGDDGAAQRLIKTLPRKGIRFVGAVREQAGQAAGAAPAERAAAPPQPALALPDKPSIAVLPFTNMSGDPEQDYFADGMAEEIITALSRCPWLFVIARNSSFTYKARSVDVRQVGHELGVRYVLEGSVRRGGDRLRFTGQLIDAASGAHIWADRFDGELSDVFGLQDRFTESVVGAIEPKLQLAEIERIKQKRTGDLTAYDLMLRAQQLHYEFTAEGFDGAIRCLHQALAIDPQYPQAMALAAHCYSMRRLQVWAPDPETEAVVGCRLAMRALDLAKDDSNVLWMAAHAVRLLGREPLRARELLRLSLALNPHSFMALSAAAWNEAILANSVEALELVARAERVSPRDPRAWFMNTARLTAYFFGGQFEETVMWARRVLAQNPRSSPAVRTLAASLALLGRTAEAAEVFKESVAIDPNLTITKQRQKLSNWPDHAWQYMSEGLRLAGMPE